MLESGEQRMTITDSRPQLIINYSPQLDLRITLAEVLDYAGAALPDYRCEVNCCWRYARGSFSYCAENIYFASDAFARFERELHGVQQGQREEAALHDPGEMVVLRLERKANKLFANFDVREYVPPSTAKLHVVVEVDYDLFVNKLKSELDRFIAELRNAGSAN